MVPGGVRLLPFYLVLGVRAEHRVAAHRMLVELRDDLAAHPTLTDTVRFGLIEFSGAADVRQPLCDLLDPELTLPEPTPGDGATSYGSALTALKAAIGTDFAELTEAGFVVRRPAAWLLTDRGPTDAEAQWRAALAELTDTPGYPNIVPSGFGDADADALRSLIYPTAGVAPMRMYQADGPDPIGALGQVLALSMIESGRRLDSDGADVVLPTPDRLPPDVRVADARLA